MLEGMESDYAGYARSVKAVLKEPSLKHLSIYGTISGLVEVKREYVAAVETALGGALQNIIVEDEEDAKAAIEFLRRTKAGRATFLPVSSVHGKLLDNVRQVSSCDGFIGVASELVSYKKRYDGIVKSLLGRVVVVDNIDNAIAMSRRFGYKFRVVTLEGAILNAGGSMSGGSMNKQSGLMSRAAEIRELTSEILKLTNELKNLREERSKRIDEVNEIKERLAGYMPIVREYEDEILRLENTIRHLTATVENGGSTGENYMAELANIEKQLKESSDETAKILAEIRSHEAEVRRLEKVLEEKNEEYESVSAEREAQSKSIMDETMRLAALQRDVQALEDKIKTSEREISAADTEIKEKEEYRTELLSRCEELERSIEEKEKHRGEIAGLSE